MATFTVEILEDGEIKITTNDMSGPLHLKADDLFKSVARLGGGEVTDTKHGLGHHHEHGHTHDHHDTHDTVRQK